MNRRPWEEREPANGQSTKDSRGWSNTVAQESGCSKRMLVPEDQPEVAWSDPGSHSKAAALEAVMLRKRAPPEMTGEAPTEIQGDGDWPGGTPER